MPNTQVNTATLSITITGQNIQPGCSAVLQSAQFGLVPLISPTCTQSTTVSGAVPQNIVAGFYTVTVTNPDSQFGALANAYTATNPVPGNLWVRPAITNTNIPTLTITITGKHFRNTGFPGDLRVTLGNTSLSALTFVSSNTVTALLPGSLPIGQYTLTITNPGPTAPAATLTNALTLYTIPDPAMPPACTDPTIINCNNAAGDPDGLLARIPPGITGTITLDFGAGNGITDGPGYDLVYYERVVTAGIWLDYITITVSTDGAAWYPVLAWDGVAGNVNGTNIDSYATDADGEQENEPIPATDLYPAPSGTLPNYGIAIDLNGVIPAVPGGPFRYVRFAHPLSATEPAQIDALVRLH